MKDPVLGPIVEDIFLSVDFDFTNLIPVIAVLFSILLFKRTLDIANDLFLQDCFQLFGFDSRSAGRASRFISKLKDVIDCFFKY